MEELAPTEHPAIDGEAFFYLLVPGDAIEHELPFRRIPWALCGSYLTSRSGQAILSGREKRERTGIELEVRGELEIHPHPCDVW